MTAYDDEIIDQGELDSAQRATFLTFKLVDGDYGIAVEYVSEIVGLLPITAVPQVRPYIRGIINLRGEIIPVMDVRRRFELEPCDYDERTCIIVVDHRETKIGLIVDRVLEVIGLGRQSVESPPSMGGSGCSDAIQGLAKVEQRILMMVDMERLLYTDDIDAVRVTAQAS